LAGAATHTFAPGGKHSRAAIDSMILCKVYSRHFLRTTVLPWKWLSFGINHRRDSWERMAQNLLFS